MVMRDLSGSDILATRFEVGRRKGYDTIEVDRFLEELALYVDELRSQLADSQSHELTAMALLSGARKAADDVLMGSAIAAGDIERDLERRRDAADVEAQRIVADARAHALEIVDEARKEADALSNHKHREMAALDNAIVEKRSEFDAIRNSVSEYVVATIDQLRGLSSQSAAAAQELQTQVLDRFDLIDLTREHEVA